MEKLYASVGSMISVVTTFSPRGYEVYGRRFLESFEKHWPDDVGLFVFHEGEKPDDATERAIWRPLDADKDRARFMAEHKDPENGDYRTRAVMYSHKVWAMTSAPRGSDHLFWLDADSVTIAPVTNEILEQLCADPGQVGAYLARPYYRYTETGFLSFSMKAGGGDFLDQFRKAYILGDVFNLSELHDCMVFDWVRRKFERAGYRWKNLCPTARSSNVFEQSPLKNIVTHNKGPVRKEKVYGAHMVPGLTGHLKDHVRQDIQ